MLFSISRRTAAPAAGAAFAQLLTVDAIRRVAVRSITIVVATAVAGEIGLIRDLTRGTRVAASTQAGQPWNPSNVPSVDCVLTTGWAVAPTIAATPAYLGRVMLPATIGAGVTWNFAGENGLILAPQDTGSILIWNFGAGAGPALDVSVDYESVN